MTAAIFPVQTICKGTYPNPSPGFCYRNAGTIAHPGISLRIYSVFGYSFTAFFTDTPRSVAIRSIWMPRESPETSTVLSASASRRMTAPPASMASIPVIREKQPLTLMRSFIGIGDMCTSPSALIMFVPVSTETSCVHDTLRLLLPGWPSQSVILVVRTFNHMNMSVNTGFYHLICSETIYRSDSP